MSYTIYAKLIQSNASSWYSVVEKSVWNYANGGTWTETGTGEHVLTMGGSGTSGLLRFKNSEDHYLTVILGIHNNTTWCDALLDLKPSDTGVYIHPTYYVGERRSSLGVHKTISTSPNGVTVKVNFDKEDGKTSWVTITIT